MVSQAQYQKNERISKCKKIIKEIVCFLKRVDIFNCNEKMISPKNKSTKINKPEYFFATMEVIHFTEITNNHFKLNFKYRNKNFLKLENVDTSTDDQLSLKNILAKMI